MYGRSASRSFLWGPYTVALASAALTVLSLLSSDKRPWYVAIIVFAYIVMHSGVSHLRDRSIVRRLGRQHDSVQRRALRIVADLGELVGGRFDLWMVDLYLVRPNCRMIPNWPFIVYERELSRELSVSLAEVSTQPAKVKTNSDLYGTCFTSKNTIVWFDETALGALDSVSQRSIANEWKVLTEEQNAKIGDTYGLVTMSPVTDHLDKKCVGVLVVHVKPERDKALRAHGAMLSSEGRRRVHNACVDLHQLLLT